MDAVTVMIDNGANALLELTGEKATEAVVDEVFSKFCVGSNLYGLISDRWFYYAKGIF